VAGGRPAIGRHETVAVIVDPHLPSVVDHLQANPHPVRPGVLAHVYQRLHRDPIQDDASLGRWLRSQSILNFELEAGLGLDPLELGTQRGGQAGAIQGERAQVEHQAP